MRGADRKDVHARSPWGQLGRKVAERQAMVPGRFIRLRAPKKGASD